MVFSCRVSYRRMFSITTTTTIKQLASTSQDPADDHEQQRQDSSGLYTSTSNDSHVVIVMAALLCVLLCAMGISSLIRCALRWSRWPGLESEQAPDSRHGMKKRDVRSLPIIFYSKGKPTSCASSAASAAATNHHAETAGSECAICLGDFVDGEVLRILPTCKHGFHIACIDAWLLSHSSCPTCRHNPIAGPMIADKKLSAINSSLGTCTQMQTIANSVLVAANPA